MVTLSIPATNKYFSTHCRIGFIDASFSSAAKGLNHRHSISSAVAGWWASSNNNATTNNERHTSSNYGLTAVTTTRAVHCYKTGDIMKNSGMSSAAADHPADWTSTVKLPRASASR